ncbi:MAG: acetyl-CoA acetyltransferase [Acidimicrobiales bacterium]
MSTDWTRVPVVVGGGQITSREQDPAAAPDPFALMVEASRQAAEGAGGGGAPGVAERLAGLTHLFMVHSLSLRHGDPAPELARRLGATGAEARLSGMGGSIPQWLVNRAAELVVDGGRPRVLIAGAEALATRRRAKKQGITLDWPSSEGWPDTWPPLEPDLGVHPVERAHGLVQATTMYALVESAVAHGAREDAATHSRAVGELMAGFNAVAAANPGSWFPARRSAAEIMDVTPDNRMICYPYPKYVNAVMDVDMGAAVLVTDAATAREWGLGPDEVAYLAGWADAHDIWYLSERPVLHRSPALAQCAARVLDTAGMTMDAVDGLDLYACFPSSVEVARDSFGIDAADPRPLTLTGGLPYHGGPGSNYVTHAIANALAWLRRGDGDAALVHGNGYYLTKHSVGLYTRRPPHSAPLPPDGLQQSIDAATTALPVEVSVSAGDVGTVVAYTVPFDREGAPTAAVAVVDVGGVRTVACGDDALTAAFMAGDGVGASVVLGQEGGTNTMRGA